MNLGADAKFKVTLGAAVLFIGGVFTFGWKAQATLSSIDATMKATVARLDAVESKLNDRINGFEAIVADRFTKTAAAEWALRFQILNPNLPVPDPRNPMVLLGMKLTEPLRQNTRLDWK